MGRLLSDVERHEIARLRHNGHTISEISNRTGRGKATIAPLVKGLAVSPEHLEHWKSKRGGSRNRAQKRWENAQSIVSGIISNLDNKDKLLILSCLYWGEGNKTEFSFSNTDPLMIKSLVSCLESYGLRLDDLLVSVRIYEDIDAEAAKNYWAGVVGVPTSKIQSVNMLEGKKKGKLEYGMCRLRIRKGEKYFKLVKSTISLLSMEFTSSP